MGHTSPMIRFELGFGLFVMALWVFCLVDVISSPEGEIRNLPKVPWVFIVLLFPLAGSIAWLVAGRPRAAPGRSRYERTAPAFPEYDRPGRAAATNPEDDEEFLRRVRERAEEQRRAHRESQLAREREEHEKLQRRLKRGKQDDPEAGS
ncbi:MAG: hypothetical protein JWP24_2447 [Marmoricola sp.]|nr:hypothetical protein [Marmoricola sp.]